MQKTTALLISSNSIRFFKLLNLFFFSNLTNMLSIFSEVVDSGEIVISFGLINRSLPMSNISFESVAEKNKVCLIRGNN